MTNKWKITRWTVVIIIFFMASSIIQVEVGYAISVKPILPKNQHDSKATYYDLRMIPGQEQDLILELENTSDKEEKVTLQINDATTNEVGEIDYSDRSKSIPRDKSLKLSFKDIATTESKIMIPPKQKITTAVHLKMPDDSFNGMVLGGIKVVSSERNNELIESDNNEKQKTYIVAVKLTETDTPIEAELDLLGIFSSKESDKSVIKAMIQNKQATNLEDIEYTAKTYEKNSDKIVNQTKVTGCRMAPNSSFSFIIAEEKQKFKTGKYQVHLTAKSKETKQEWKWTKEIDITKDDEEKKINKLIIGSDKEDILFYTVISVITLVLLLLALLFLLILRKRKEKQYEEALLYRRKTREINNKDYRKIRTPKVNKRNKVREKNLNSRRSRKKGRTNN